MTDRPTEEHAHRERRAQQKDKSTGGGSGSGSTRKFRNTGQRLAGSIASKSARVSMVVSNGSVEAVTGGEAEAAMESERPRGVQ